MRQAEADFHEKTEYAIDKTVNGARLCKLTERWLLVTHTFVRPGSAHYWYSSAVLEVHCYGKIAWPTWQAPSEISDNRTPLIAAPAPSAAAPRRAARAIRGRSNDLCQEFSRPPRSLSFRGRCRRRSERRGDPARPKRSASALRPATAFAPIRSREAGRGTSPRFGSRVTS